MSIIKQRRSITFHYDADVVMCDNCGVTELPEPVGFQYFEYPIDRAGWHLSGSKGPNKWLSIYGNGVNMNLCVDCGKDFINRERKTK